MVTPQRSIELVKLAIEDADVMPDSTNYLTHEADAEYSDADVYLPLVQIQPLTSARITPMNTDFVGWVVDVSGNKTGRLYHAEYQLVLQIDVWVAEQTDNDASELGTRVRNALYEYSSYGLEKQFKDEDGNPIDEIWHFEIGDGERADDLTMTHTIRRWRQSAELWGYETFDTTEQYITGVNHPSPADFNDSDADGVIENT